MRRVDGTAGMAWRGKVGRVEASLGRRVEECPGTVGSGPADLEWRGAVRQGLDSLGNNGIGLRPGPKTEGGMVRKRFEYRKMTGEELTRDLRAIGMSHKAFARITGSVADRVKQWCDGEEDIPNWTPILVAILKNVPGAIVEARQEAAERIKLDLSHPDLGEYPYLEKEDVPDD